MTQWWFGCHQLGPISVELVVIPRETWFPRRFALEAEERTIRQNLITCFDLYVKLFQKRKKNNYSSDVDSTVHELGGEIRSNTADVGSQFSIVFVNFVNLVKEIEMNVAMREF